MTLATFHADISAVIARGSSQAAKIPRWTRHANQWLEQNYSFKFMEKHGESALDPLAEAPNVLTLPNERIKSVTMVQPMQLGDRGTRRYGEPLPKADRRKVLSLDLGYPTGWWQVGNTLHFDGIVDRAYDLNLMWFEYTDWPTETTATPVMLQRYENLLFAQTLVEAWRELKDPAALADWTNTRDMALRAVLVAEDADVWEAQDMRMEPGRGVEPSY